MNNAANARATTASGFSGELRPVEPLSERHRTDLLGSRLLEHFLRCKRYDHHSKRTFVLSQKDFQVVGWYCLVAGIAGPDMEPLPVMRLADIAVAEKFRGNGLSETLEEDAVRRISTRAERRVTRR
jgi:hypothetical protein